MARGWDSKAIEDQIADAEAEKAARAKPYLTTDEREVRARLESLRLSRVEISRRLGVVCDERYRVQLSAALEHLDSEIRALDPIATTEGPDGSG